MNACQTRSRQGHVAKKVSNGRKKPCKEEHFETSFDPLAMMSQRKWMGKAGTIL